jgi:signal peptidase I
VGAAAALVLLLVVRVWCLDGLLRRVLIEGPSMATAFCGAHFEVRCGDCDFPFVCDAEHMPSDGKAVCPNCGFTENTLNHARLMPAERVLIDRWPLLFRGPRSGEVVALCVPSSDGDLAVKRVEGLPGGRLAIRGGDLFDGSKIVRKSPEELRAVRVLVHDNNYHPQKTTGLPARWHEVGDNSKWRPAQSGFQIEAGGRTDACDWLEYEHWPCTANPHLRGTASPVTDNDAYNQGELHRPLNAVRDVSLSCQLQAEATGRVVLAVVDGAQRFELLLLPTNPSVLLLDGRQLFVVPIDLSHFARGAHIEFGLCDQQVLLAVNRKTVICTSYDRSGGTESEPLHPLAVGSIGASLRIEDLKVWRDIYYLDANGLSRDWEAESQLAANEYALLGDNPPVSIDSRHWPGVGISRRALLGLVRKK